MFPGRSPYEYTFSNPINFIDPTGMKGESTHIDKDGNVIAVIDDGDKGVYQHGNNADGGKPTEYMITKRQEKQRTSAGGKKIGETEYGDEFIVPGTNRAEGRILIGESWKKE